MIQNHFQKLKQHIDTRSRITMRHIAAMTGADSQLILIILLSVLNIILSPLPGNSIILGIPLVLVSVAYILNIDPSQFRMRAFRTPFATRAWRVYTERAADLMALIEKFSRPRWPHMLKSETRIGTGISMIVMAVIIVLPIPFANIPASMGMICLAIGVLERDGIFFLAGHLNALLHVIALITALIFSTSFF